jgi:ribosomal protein L21
VRFFAVVTGGLMVLVAEMAVVTVEPMALAVGSACELNQLLFDSDYHDYDKVDNTR